LIVTEGKPPQNEVDFESVVATTPDDYNYKYFYVNQGYSKRLVSLWLYGATGLVLFMILVGGYTRLTGAGLSMVRWKPVGYRYPKSDEDWEAEYQIYKQYPEFQANPETTLPKFKRIYNIEFFHRFVGNVIGGYFALPMAYFWLRGYFTQAMKRRTTILLTLGGLQGLIGWWMVRSGMGAKPDYHIRPKVSTYRLIIHNTMAMSLYFSLFYMAVRVGKPMRYYPQGAFDATDLKRIRAFAMLIIHCVGFNLLSGVAVAGIDAGQVYNTWPLMNGHIIPPGYWRPELGWRNLFENLGCVQANHRTFAYITLSAVYFALLKTWKRPLPLNLRMGLLAVFGLVNFQVLLGILMLVQQVPVRKGVEHQFNAILILTASVYLLAATRGKAIRIV
jgi:cytochrome c oxidase assembly protein subunit 15